MTLFRSLRSSPSEDIAMHGTGSHRKAQCELIVLSVHSLHTINNVYSFVLSARTVLRRIAKSHAHSIKVRAKVKAKGSEEFFGPRRSNWVRSKARTQALWSLHLAGDFQSQFETVLFPSAIQHKMRVMMIANLSVPSYYSNSLCACVCVNVVTVLRLPGRPKIC